MKLKQLRPSSRLMSVKYALQGMVTLFRGEPNAWIHLTATIIVVTGATMLDFSALEWVMTIFAIGIVIAAEALNSSVEALCDYACPHYNELIGKAKDLAAAGVLIAAIAAAIIGAILFIPKLIDLI